MNNFIQNKIMPPMMKFLNTRAVTAIKNGMIYPIPFIIIGSVFLILGQLPFQAGQDFMNKIKLGPLFLQINNASFGIMALLAVFGIAYAWVRDAGYEGVPAGLTGIIVHILLQPDTIHQVTSVTDPTKVSTAYQVGGVIDRAWLGGKGMVLSIIVGLLVGWIYTGFMRRNITIKMPEQVPENVAASFTSLVPAGAIIALAGVVHGATIIGGIMGPLLQANSADNAALYKAGHLSLSNGAHIVTQSFMDQYLTVTGSGLTIGLVIFLLVSAKSVQGKTLGRMEIGPAVFNINEPILFGLPIVLNPILAIPFILAPLISGILTYLVIYLGIIPPFNGAYVPWTTPAVLSGYLVGGWQGMVWQVIILALTSLLYWPFAKAYDNILLKEEAETEAEINAAE